MNLLSDILTYIRRIIKSPSNSVISDNLLIDYVNRFWIMDVDARIQLFDLKTTYTFITQPGVDQYNMPLYGIQTEPGNQTISYYPVYQGFTNPAYVNGIQVPLQTERNSFFNIWPQLTQNSVVLGTGDGVTTNFTLTFPIAPSNSTPLNPPIQALLRGHVDISGIIAAANSGPITDPIIGSTLNTNVPYSSINSAVYISYMDSTGTTQIVQDSGQILSNFANYGLLMQSSSIGRSYPFGYNALPGGYSNTLNTINYFTGTTTLNLPNAPAAGADIVGQCYFFQSGLPRAMLFYNNTLTLRSPPDTNYRVDLDAYLSPAAFLSTGAAVPFGYMSEYIARGAARKIMADTGDVEQFQFYEPLFKEQEMLVWKRSQRQFTSSRTQTIYSQGINQGQSGFNNIGGSTI